MANGLSATGFQRKRLDEIKTDIEALFISVFGANLDISPESPDGQIIGLLADAYANLWEIAEGDYNIFNPSAATNAALSNLVQLNGITRQEATASTVTLTLSGTPGTSVPAGSQVSTNGGTTFTTDVTAVIGGGGSVDVDATATETGAIIATAGTIINIDTPITGWSSVTNAANAVLGRDEETDVELRARRVRSVARASKGFVNSIIAEVLAVTNVVEAFIYENDTGITDVATGTPAKSFQVVALGGTDQAVAEAIFNEKPIGIGSFGSTTVNIADSQGTLHAINFTRPTAIPIYIIVNLTKFASYPINGADTIKQKLVDYANGDLILGRGFGVGADVVQSELYTPVNQVIGHRIDSIYIGTSPTPTLENDIVIAFDEISGFDIANITVNEA